MSDLRGDVGSAVLKTSPPTPPTSGGSWRWLRFGVGLVLILAAVWVVATQGEALRSAVRSIKDASPWRVLAVLLLPLSSMLITTTIFWLLTRRFGPVGWWEMAALIGSAWLLNMLPFKPGLVGRIAYHKAISGIPVSRSIAVVFVAMLIGIIGIALTLGAVAVSMPSDERAGLRWLVAIGACTLAIVAGFVARRMLRGETRNLLRGRMSELGLCILLRVVDTLLWALRYLLAFDLIGVTADYRSCVIYAGVSQIAGQMPVQLGLREWSVGLASSIFGRPIAGANAGGLLDGGPTLSVQGVLPGLQADLLTRAAEIACALPIGLISYLWIARKLKQTR